MQPKKGAVPLNFARFAKKSKSKKPVTAAQAKMVAAKYSKKAPAPAVDAEDLLDGGVDEAKEKS